VLFRSAQRRNSTPERSSGTYAEQGHAFQYGLSATLANAVLGDEE
jgi:hypothetical protein